MVSVRKELRIREALERNAKWNDLTVAEQWAYLDLRLGLGIGAAKQRKKLARKLEKAR